MRWPTIAGDTRKLYRHRRTFLPLVLSPIGPVIALAVRKITGGEIEIHNHLSAWLGAAILFLLGPLITLRSPKLGKWFRPAALTTLALGALTIAIVDTDTQEPGLVAIILICVLAVCVQSAVLVVAIPRVFLPAVRQRQFAPLPAADGNIIAKLRHLGDGFRDAHERLLRDVREVEKAAQALHKRIQLEQKSVTRIELELASKRGALSEHETLLALSAEQEVALLSALDKRRVIDYGVGFAVGIASAIAGELIFRVLFHYSK